MGTTLAEAKPLKILVYRRTHTGDPSRETGECGIHDCMGQVRDWAFDAVIGIGGKKPWAGDEKIAEKSLKLVWASIRKESPPSVKNLT